MKIVSKYGALGQCRKGGNRILIFLTFSMRRTRVLIVTALCLYCGRVFKTHDGLELHQRARHFRCNAPGCPRRGQRFKSVSALQTHCLKVHPDKPLAYVPNAYSACSSLGLARLLEFLEHTGSTDNELYTQVLAFHRRKLEALHPRRRIRFALAAS
ncbi:Hypothetical protein GSB_27699 [Giardia duodenalis]|uniref:C2H2-type domain-containing protein n=1 Tax=Giardia intestinalis TaxID=5741 RepID=V6U1Y4_GIAIN|nr:Hypothetical protein GSB_27699 [Giardia intestinalis]